MIWLTFLWLSSVFHVDLLYVLYTELRDFYYRKSLGVPPFLLSKFIDNAIFLDYIKQMVSIASLYFQYSSGNVTHLFHKF